MLACSGLRTTGTLDDLARSGLRNDPDGVNQWCRSLEARFRESLALLESVRYTVKDAKNRRDPADYINTIVLNSKDAAIAATEAAKVLLAYEHMDGELRRHLPRPTDSSTVSSLLSEIRHQKDIWFDIYGKPEVTISCLLLIQILIGVALTKDSAAILGLSGPFGNPFLDSQNRNNNEPQQQQPQQQNVQARTLPGGRQQLQITSGNVNVHLVHRCQTPAEIPTGNPTPAVP